MVNHGLFDILITPDHCGECLISTDQLNSSGRIVTMTTTETIIADVLHRYDLRYLREPGNRDYPCHWMYFTALVNYESSTR